jgi:ATP-dependent protease ClpP protease subunit
MVDILDDKDGKGKDKDDDGTPSDLNFVKDGVVYIYGDFDDTIAKSVIPDLMKLVKEQEEKKNPIIKIYIDSNGGYTRYLYSLLAILEQAKAKGIVIETYVYAYAYSCGSLLACAGTKGHRHISYLAEHCCHLGQASMGNLINDVELERAKERVQSHFDKVRNLYRKYANLKDLENQIKFDNWFLRGQEIIDNGLADKFVD